MATRMHVALRAVRLAGDRIDPTAPFALGTIARDLSIALSGASRLCAEIAAMGLLERGAEYGTFSLGPRAVALSARAAEPLALPIRYSLTRLAQETTETALLAVPDGHGARVIAAVESGWTLHSPALVGEHIADPASAVVRGLRGPASVDVLAIDNRAVVSELGRTVEIAVPVMNADGARLAVAAVRLPVYRAGRGAPRARRALMIARRELERSVASWHDAPHPAAGPTRRSAPDPRGSLEAMLDVLEHLADGPDTPAGVAHTTGLRVDRTKRLLDSANGTGLVEVSGETGRFRLAMTVHGWYRATTAPRLLKHGRPLVAQTADRVHACVFLTVLKGMHSFTLVEELRVIGEGLLMAPWLNRPHPIVGSDGGPTLVMDFTPDQLSALFPPRHSPAEFRLFVDRVTHARQHGVLTMKSIDEFGITSVSAPVRDASGTIAAAACIVGTTEEIMPRLTEVEDAAKKLAAAVSARLVDPQGASHTARHRSMMDLAISSS